MGVLLAGSALGHGGLWFGVGRTWEISDTMQVVSMLVLEFEKNVLEQTVLGAYL